MLKVSVANELEADSSEHTSDQIFDMLDREVLTDIRREYSLRNEVPKIRGTGLAYIRLTKNNSCDIYIPLAAIEDGEVEVLEEEFFDNSYL